MPGSGPSAISCKTIDPSHESRAETLGPWMSCELRAASCEARAEPQSCYAGMAFQRRGLAGLGPKQRPVPSTNEACKLLRTKSSVLRVRALDGESVHAAPETGRS